MRATAGGIGLLLVALGGGARATAAPLASSEAGVVGGWVDAGLHQVRRLLIAQVEDAGGCLKFVEGGARFEIEDHLTPARPVMWKVHRVTPGRYAIWAVGWGDVVGSGYLANTWYGQSRQHGALAIFDAQAGAVTDIGVWTVTSPYYQRYIVGAQDAEAGRTAAEALAAGVGPLVRAHIVRAPVALPKTQCPAPSGPG